MKDQDQAIQAALQDVPIPAGLLERLHAAVERNAVERNAVERNAVERAGESSSTPAPALSGSVDQCLMELPPACDESVTSVEPRSASVRVLERLSSRSEMVRRGLIVLALASMLGGFAWIASQWSQPLERDWLVAHCQKILEKWEQDNPANLEAVQVQLPQAVQSQLMRVRVAGARPLLELGTKLKGMLYRMETEDGRSVVLLQLSDLSNVRGLSTRFSRLGSPSGGWSLAALTVNNETYVLAAVGTEQQLFHYIYRAAVT